MATKRLTLSSVGIRNPLDVADAGRAAEDGAPRVAQPDVGGASRPRSSTRSPRRRAAPPATRAEPVAERTAPFYGSGARVQTSIALDADYARLLDELARAAHVPVNALATAVVQAGLPSDNDEARAAIVDERVRCVDMGEARVQRNLRMPVQLRARIDELVAAARERMPRVNRADLVNAALGRGLPGDAQQAASLVADYSRRLERSAAA